MNGSSWIRFAQRSGYSGLFLVTLATSPSALGEIRSADCARAAKYSESKRGASVLVMQNGRTIFEHYANDGSAGGRWPIFSGTKSFWGIAALAAVRDGLFKLDDPVADTITEWKSDPRKSQITIRQLLSQTDGIEGASLLQRASIRDRNPWQFGCQLLLNPARRSFMVRVIFRFFASCCAGNWEAAAPSHTSRDTYPAGLGLAASTTKKILSAIRYRRQDLS